MYPQIQQKVLLKTILTFQLRIHQSYSDEDCSIAVETSVFFFYKTFCWIRGYMTKHSTLVFIRAYTNRNREEQVLAIYTLNVGSQSWVGVTLRTSFRSHGCNLCLSMLLPALSTTTTITAILPCPCPALGVSVAC